MSEEVLKPNLAEIKPRSSAFSMLLVGSGGAAAQALTIAATPILTRLYTPESYAVWAILMSLITVLSSIATLRYELAIVLPKREEEASNVFLVALIASLLLSALGVPLIFLLKSRFIEWMAVPELSGWLLWSPLLVAMMGSYQATTSWCTRTARFTWLAFSGIALSLLTSGAQITAALLGYANGRGLILGTLIGQSAAALLMLGLIGWQDGKKS